MNRLDNLDEMDKFLETQNRPRWNHEEIENMKKPVMSKEIESVRASNKIQHPLMIKTLKVVMEGNCFNMIMAIDEKPRANILLNVERLKVFPLRSGTRQGCLFLSLLSKIALEVLARAIIRQRHPNWKEKA